MFLMVLVLLSSCGGYTSGKKSVEIYNNSSLKLESATITPSGHIIYVTSNTNNPIYPGKMVIADENGKEIKSIKFIKN